MKKNYPFISGLEEKVILIGIKNSVYQEKIGGQFEDHYEKILLATFDTEKLAREYIKKARLNIPKHERYSTAKIFKNKTLLSGCEDAEIETYQDLPHNPEIGE